MKMSPILTEIFCFAIIVTTGFGNSLKTAREAHRNQISTNNDYRYLASKTDVTYINQILNNILIPRVVGTEGHEKAFRYIVKELRKLKWHVDVDEFVARTPTFGDLTFKNIIATPKPQAGRFLVLGCHYETKYFKNAHFVGAIDSAVPCAMMLDIAASLSKELTQNSDTDVSLKLIFFDGEEAFKHWGPRDSLYGSKHLAEQLQSNRTTIGNELISELDKIDMLVLLDLIGAKNPTFLNFFENTRQWFVRHSQIEQELHRLELLKKHRYHYFQHHNPFGRIEDDYLPFMERGVPILHLITTPFPREWHTPNDNRDLIDLDTVTNVNLILKAFISEYLHLLV